MVILIALGPGQAARWTLNVEVHNGCWWPMSSLLFSIYFAVWLWVELPDGTSIFSDLSEDEDDVIGSFAVPRPLQECLYASQNFLFSSDQPSIDCGASLAGFHSPARRDQNRHSKSPKKAQPEKLQSAFPVQMDAVVGHDAQCLPVQDCVYQSILSTSRYRILLNNTIVDN